MCDCRKYEDLELTRSQITARIRESKALRPNLTLIASHTDKEHQLYRCEECGQLWQSSRAWNWGNDRYLFRIPAISESEWLSEVFVQPDELLIFAAVMCDFLEKNSFKPSHEKCAISECERLAVAGLRTCLPHHIDSLQRVGRLPQSPIGQWFGPYKYESIIPTL